MSRAKKIIAGTVAAGVFLGLIVWLMLIPFRPGPRSLALVFEKYGRVMDGDFKPEEVAFFWFTNASSKSFLLPMVGSTNTSQRDTPLAFDSSYLCAYQFADPANPGVQSSIATYGICNVVAPHSAVRLRVPLPVKCQKQKVGVLCFENPATSRAFWTKGIGLSVLRTLPRSIGRHLFNPWPEVQWVWCNQELSRPDERPGPDSSALNFP